MGAYGACLGGFGSLSRQRQFLGAEAEASRQLFSPWKGQWRWPVWDYGLRASLPVHGEFPRVRIPLPGWWAISLLWHLAARVLRSPFPAFPLLLYDFAPV